MNFQRAERLLFAALARLFIENGAQPVTIKPQAKAMVFSEPHDSWFAPFPIVWPDAIQFFLIDRAVFCRLQLLLDLSYQFAHTLQLYRLDHVHLINKIRTESDI